ncbi:prenyltransferase/squalene oxidase repeat-containing protein, partial [Streptomyces calidiresistens]
MTPLRGATALAGATLLLLGTAAPAGADDATATPSPASAGAEGLYGDTDPTWDGVWRQSLAMLALEAAGEPAPPAAVTWLLGQQCPEGGFPAHLPEPGAACDGDPAVDTNATGMAVQALAAVADGDAAADAALDSAVEWLLSARNEDGGWPYASGGESDANSTAVALSALYAIGADPAEVAGAEEALLAFRLGCEAPEAERGAFVWQPEEDGSRYANELATVDAVLALGAAAGDRAPDGPPATPACEDDGDGDGGNGVGPAEALEGGLAWLLSHTTEGGGWVRSPFDNSPMPGPTARVAHGLAAGGWTEEARAVLAPVEEEVAGGGDAYEGAGTVAELILAVEAVGADPTDFGGVDLTARLIASGPDADAPATEPGDRNDGDAADGETGTEDAGGGLGSLWFLGALLLAGVGVGLLAALRRGGNTGGNTGGDGTGAPGGDAGGAAKGG